MPSVMIATPVMRGQIETEFLMSMLSMQRRLLRKGIPNVFAKVESSLISESRNSIVDRMPYDYLLWVDSDMQFPATAVERLLKHDLDIVGGVYYTRTPPIKPVLFSLDEQGYWNYMMDFPSDKLFEVHGIGTGFLLIKKRVLEAFTEDVVSQIGRPFNIVSHPVSQRQDGEDLAFCRRALHLGFKIYADPTIDLGHVGRRVYGRSDFLASRPGTYDNEIDGWMTGEELNWLHEKAKTMQSIVEIGSYKGRSTHALLSACSGTVWAVDHFKPSEGVDTYDEFVKNVGQFPNLKVMKMDSLKAAYEFDRQVDMVFIDAAHDYASVKADIEAWRPRCKKLLCGHDYNWDAVREAVTEKLGVPDGVVGSIWFKEIKNG